MFASVSFTYLNIKIEENICLYLMDWGRLMARSVIWPQAVFTRKEYENINVY